MEMEIEKEKENENEENKKEFLKLAHKIKCQNKFFRVNLIKKIEKKMRSLEKSSKKLEQLNRLKEEKQKKQIEWMNFKLGNIDFSYKKYIKFINSEITEEDLNLTKNKILGNMGKIKVNDTNFSISDLKNILKSFKNN